MTALDALLDRLPRTILVVGKGGVGKTTIAAGLAASYAERGLRALVLSTDPAAALGTAIGEPIGGDATPIAGHPSLAARQLDGPALRHAFLDRWRDVLAEIVDRGTYLDRSDVDGLVDAALPGADEIFGLLAIADILADHESGYARIIIDTAPTGHTLRLLALPETFSGLLSMLDLMQEKHRFMVRALTHRYRRDRADDFLIEMRARIEGLRTALADAASVGAVVVTRAEWVVLAETERYIAALGTLNVQVHAVIVNANDDIVPMPDAVHPMFVVRRTAPPHDLATIVETLGTMQAVNALRARGPHGPVAGPATPAGGAPNVEDFLDVFDVDERDVGAADPEELDAERLLRRERATRASRYVPSDRVLTIVGGKGGVGKTTTACALAIAAVDADGRATLLVSTDPAASLADALGTPDAPWAHEDIEHSVIDVPGLVVRQLDAAAAFAGVRDEYRPRIDALFDTLVGRGLSIDPDRAVMRDLLALAPPGIDELFALSILGDALESERFARIIVDPAPTGHLLRLLDMPAVALEWTHRLMRLMLKYRDSIGLGDTARELLDFAKRTRSLEALLHDAARTAVVIVALDEPVVRAETARLAAALHARGIATDAVVWNRSSRAPAPLPDSPTVRQLFATEVVPSPTGVAALRAWSHSWSQLPPHP